MSVRANPVRFTLLPALGVAAAGAWAIQSQLSLLLPMSWWLSINLVTFVVWWIDKRRARRQAFRVPEWTLHLLSLVGGGVGAVTAMRTLRHKTLKPVFRYLHPLLAIAGVAAVAWAWSR
ncbi:MAG: DUF1294 domain-containing protein [Planctomycetota bacterium]